MGIARGHENVPVEEGRRRRFPIHAGIASQLCPQPNVISSLALFLRGAFRRQFQQVAQRPPVRWLRLSLRRCLALPRAREDRRRQRHAAAKSRLGRRRMRLRDVVGASEEFHGPRGGGGIRQREPRQRQPEDHQPDDGQCLDPAPSVTDDGRHRDVSRR